MQATRFKDKLTTRLERLKLSGAISLHAQPEQSLVPARRPANNGRRTSQSQASLGPLQRQGRPTNERRVSYSQTSLAVRQSILKEPDAARGSSTASPAMQQRRLSQGNVPQVMAVKAGMSSVGSLAASSTVPSSVRRASKVPQHDPDVYHHHHFGAFKDIPRPFYSFVASCHHLLDKMEEHIVPRSVFNMEVRHITSSQAKNDKVSEICYAWGITYKTWNISAIEGPHKAWYDKIQQDILQLYNDYHHYEHPGIHRDQHWAEVTNDLMDSSSSRMERFINHHCVLHVVGSGARQQFILWTNAHLRRIAEKKHGAPGLPIQQLKIKGNKRQGCLTIHVDESLKREREKSELMLRHNAINRVDTAPALPSMHALFGLEPPRWYKAYRHPSLGEDARPMLEGRRRSSHLAIQAQAGRSQISSS